MKIFKTSTEKSRYYPITIENFERETLKDQPWYQTDEKGEEAHYAVCPACDNPTRLIGLYSRPDPYARHHNKTVKNLAAINKDTLENCPLYLPRARPQKSSRKAKPDDMTIKILTRLVNEFDRIVYLLKKTTGIRFSTGMLTKMLETYKAERGHLYTGASLINIPWIFAYMSDSQSIFGQRIENRALLDAIRKEIPDAAISDEGQVTRATTQKKAKFFSLNVCFIHHKTDFSGSNLNERMIMVISTNQQRVIYEEKILFDHDFYQRLCLKKDFKTIPQLQQLAQGILGSDLPSSNRGASSL